jgi:hypothetical protein
MAYSDGTVNYGDVTVTLSSLGSVIIEGFTVTRPSQAIEQFTAAGVPLKQKLVEKFVTGSGTVVVPSSGTKPALFETFTYGGENWVISEVGESHSMGDYDKAPCSFRKRYN